MAPGIRPITNADARHVPALLARAFDDDPWVNFLAKQDSTREARILIGFQQAFTRVLEAGEGDVASDGSGAALWFPVEAPEVGIRPRVCDIAGTVRWTAPISGLPHLLAACRARAKVEKAHPTEPHHELRILGVEPGRQGSGIASALLRPMLERLDQGERLAALTCTKARNVPLYEHFGFEVTSEVRITRDLAVWVMQRMPRATPD